MKQMNEILMKQIAENYEAVPPGFVWENIELSLNKKKKRRHFLFFMTMSLALVILSAVLFFGGINDKNVNEKTNNTGKTEVAATVLNEDLKNKEQNVIVDKTKKKKNVTVFPIIENQYRHKEYVDIKESKESDVFANEESDLPDENSEDNKSMNEVMIKSLPGTYSLLELPVSGLNINDRIKCPDFRESRKRMFAELGFLGGYHIKSIGNGSNEILAGMRNRSESEWYTWGFYGAFGLNVTPNFYIGTGIDWTQSKDKFNHSSEAITKMIITFDPVTGIPTDTSFVTGKLITKGEIRYNSIDIPIVVGFVKNYDKWDFGLEISPVFNLNFSAKGKIFNDKNKISAVEKEPPVYRSGLGMGLKASFLIRRIISDGLYVQLKPTCKTYFNDINDGNYPLPMRYNIFGLNIGVRKDF